MTKPIIAVDIDEVLSDSAIEFIAFSNERWGTHLTIDDFQEHWSDMWQIDHEETEKRAEIWHASGYIGRHPIKEGSVDVLYHLRKRFELVITTSRRKSVEAETLAWIDKHYQGVFSGIHYSGVFENGLHAGSFTLTKSQLYEEVGATYVIDDQVKHCIGAADKGIKALLFGEYAWNRAEDLPSGVTRVRDWVAVKEYFDGIGRS